MGKRLKKLSLNGFISHLSMPGVRVAREYQGRSEVRCECDIAGVIFEATFVIANSDLDPVELFVALRESLGVDINLAAKFQPKPDLVKVS